MTGGDELMYPVDEPDWEGLPDTGEHRTVGPHRAWCHADSEWCYPQDLCWCCDQTEVPDAWKGAHVASVLGDLIVKVRALTHDGLPAAQSQVVLKREVLALIEGNSE